MFRYPKAKLTYEEVCDIIRLLEVEQERIREICRNGVGLSAISANSKSMKMASTLKNLNKLKADTEKYYMS